MLQQRHTSPHRLVRKSHIGSSELDRRPDSASHAARLGKMRLVSHLRDHILDHIYCKLAQFAHFTVILRKECI